MKQVVQVVSGSKMAHAMPSPAMPCPTLPHPTTPCPATPLPAMPPPTSASPPKVTELVLGLPQNTFRSSSTPLYTCQVTSVQDILDDCPSEEYTPPPSIPLASFPSGSRENTARVRYSPSQVQESAVSPIAAKKGHKPWV